MDVNRVHINNVFCLFILLERFLLVHPLVFERRAYSSSNIVKLIFLGTRLYWEYCGDVLTQLEWGFRSPGIRWLPVFPLIPVGSATHLLPRRWSLPSPSHYHLFLFGLSWHILVKKTENREKGLRYTDLDWKKGYMLRKECERKHHLSGLTEIVGIKAEFLDQGSPQYCHSRELRASTHITAAGTWTVALS